LSYLTDEEYEIVKYKINNSSDIDFFNLDIVKHFDMFLSLTTINLSELLFVKNEESYSKYSSYAKNIVNDLLDDIANINKFGPVTISGYSDRVVSYQRTGNYGDLQIPYTIGRSGERYLLIVSNLISTERFCMMKSSGNG